MLRLVLAAVMLGVFFPALARSQEPALPTSSALELPVTLQRGVEAGKTAVGTRVQAKLVTATLLHGVVLPRGATLYGLVTESVARSKIDPSRIAIRMESVEWKKGSAPVKLYLTSWYYPELALKNQDLAYEPPDAAHSSTKWNGMGTYPDANNPVSQQKFPGRDPGQDAGPASASPSSSISKHRILMKNVDATQSPDGTITLTSQLTNIKLDKLTTYVLASDNLLPKN